MSEIEHSTEYKSFLEDIKFNEMVANGFIKNSIAINFKEVDQSEVTRNYFQDAEGISMVIVMDVMMERWWLEVMICRNIDRFLYYITRILRQIFINYPNHLTNSDNKIRGTMDNKVDVREVLEAGSITEFIQRYADKKVHELGYLGLLRLVEYLNNKLALKFNTSMSDFQDACELVEVRNIIVHNAGRVSTVYLQRSSRKDLQSGDVYPLTKNDVLEMTNKLSKVAGELDLQIVSKFKLIHDN
jgi:hypothetical protein